MLKKNKKRRQRLLRIVKRFNGSLTKERNSDAAKNRTHIHVADIIKMDLADQKHISRVKFNGDKLTLFKEDLMTESLARRKWTTLMSIKDTELNPKKIFLISLC